MTSDLKLANPQAELMVMMLVMWMAQRTVPLLECKKVAELAFDSGN